MIRHPFAREFRKAAQAEYDELRLRETFTPVARPERARAIPLIWVFTYKLDADGFLTKFKARLCVRGDLQPITTEETYAATLATKVFRFLMALVAAFDLETWQLDAISAFLNALVNQTVYVEAPPGFHLNSKVLLLLKALYSLRQAPRLWLDVLTQFLLEYGLQPASEEVCLFSND